MTQDLIAELESEHLDIREKLLQLDRFLERPLLDVASDLEKIFSYITGFVFNQHQKKETDLLFSWLKIQNNNSDREIIDNICSEHDFFKKEINAIKKDLQMFLKNGDGEIYESEIVDRITDLIIIYRQHIEEEEKFIFLIAKALKNKN